MIVDDAMIKRINELSKKQKTVGLTDEEKAEQQKLRMAYVKAFRENLRGQLENIDFKNADGTIVSAKELHDAKQEKK